MAGLNLFFLEPMEELNVILVMMKKDPESWSVDRFWAKHKNGIAVWIGSGFFNCHIQKPNYLELGLFNRIKLYRAIGHLKTELEKRHPSS